MSRKPEECRDVPPKKPYVAPVLTEYGTLVEITAGSIASAKNDAGGGSSGEFVMKK